MSAHTHEHTHTHTDTPVANVDSYISLTAKKQKQLNVNQLRERGPLPIQHLKWADPNTAQALMFRGIK